MEDVKPPAGPAIPPRPHGNRLESFRQRFHNTRPISRRLGEAHGILSSLQRLLDQQIMNSASRIEGSSEAGQEINDSTQHTGRLSRLGTLASWMRARRLQRETEGATEGGSSGPDSVLPGNDASEFPTRGSTPLDLLEHLAMIGIANTERLTAAMSDLRRIASPSQYGGSTSSLNPQNNEPTVGPTHVAGGPSADQASNSSTVAVIQGDAGISESAGEPSNAGSSRSLRRRTRSNNLGSLDVDGEGLQRNKRRRMN
jgi:E3 ubiquitin-protein ligase RNF5